MGAAEPGISREVVAGVGRALKELGFVPPSAAAQHFVPGSVADSILDAAAAQLKDEALGLHIATRIPIGALGPLDYALCTSASLKDALRRVARFYGVVTQRVRLSLVEEGERALLLFERQPGLELSRHWLEFSFAILVWRVRQTLGKDVQLLAVELAHPAPKKCALHDEYFGLKVRFGASRDLIALPVGLLALPLTTAAESLAQVLEGRMRELEPTLGQEDALLDRVRRAVVELLDKGQVGLQPTAAVLRRSARTLQRELQLRGTSHQAILEEIRRERALVLLAEPGSQLTEVAWKLGFSEPSAFFRAFRRWTGTTPAAAAANARRAAAQ